MNTTEYSKLGGFRQNAAKAYRWSVFAFSQILKIGRLSPKCVLPNTQKWEVFAKMRFGKMRFGKYSKLRGFRQNAF